MAAALNIDTLTRLLLRKTDAEILAIERQAESVALGLSTNITNLGLSTAWNREDANVLLDACERARKARAADSAASGDDIPEPTSGHRTRFRPFDDPPGMCWGP